MKCGEMAIVIDNTSSVDWWYAECPTRGVKGWIPVTFLTVDEETEEDQETRLKTYFGGGGGGGEFAAPAPAPAPVPPLTEAINAPFTEQKKEGGDERSPKGRYIRLGEEFK